MNRCLAAAGEAMCLGSEEEGFACTRCGAPGEHCCTGDERGRITPPGGDPELWQCWNGADCSADVRSRGLSPCVLP